MSIEVERNNESRHGFEYTRPAGNKVVAPLQLNQLPFTITIGTAAATTAGYDVLLDQPIDYVRELRLVGCAGSDTTTRRLLFTGDDGKNLFSHVRSATNSGVFTGELVVSPGLSLGSGWLVKVWRDATGALPRRMNIKQVNLDGSAFVGDHKIALYFEVTTTRFQ